MWYQHRGNGCLMSKIWINCSEFECLMKSWVRYQENQGWTVISKKMSFISFWFSNFYHTWYWRTYRLEKDSVGWVEKKNESHAIWGLINKIVGNSAELILYLKKLNLHLWGLLRYYPDYILENVESLFHISFGIRYLGPVENAQQLRMLTVFPEDLG